MDSSAESVTATQRSTNFIPRWRPRPSGPRHRGGIPAEPRNRVPQLIHADETLSNHRDDDDSPPSAILPPIQLRGPRLIDCNQSASAGFVAARGKAHQAHHSITLWACNRFKRVSASSIIMRLATFHEGEDLIQRALMRSQALSRGHLQGVFDQTHVHSRIASCSPHWSCVRRADISSIELINEFLFG